MKLHRIALISVLTLAACKGDKVQPDSGADSAAAADPAVLEKKRAEEFKKRQEAFADSVLGNAPSTRAVVQKLGKGYEVGNVALRDTLVAFIAKSPKCYEDGKAVDPYLKGTVTFFVNMSVVGSDVVRVQESNWTSPAGNFTDKCFNDAARNWKFGMGLAKPGHYILQVQFK